MDGRLTQPLFSLMFSYQDLRMKTCRTKSKEPVFYFDILLTQSAYFGIISLAAALSSSSGLGHRPLTAGTGGRLPYSGPRRKASKISSLGLFFLHFRSLSKEPPFPAALVA
jgi:hypothetical protein